MSIVSVTTNPINVVVGDTFSMTCQFSDTIVSDNYYYLYDENSNEIATSFGSGQSITFDNLSYSTSGIHNFTITYYVDSSSISFNGSVTINDFDFLNRSNIDVAYSVRLLIPTYSGPVMNIRRDSDDATSDFYTDKEQTYLTTGANNTGESYSSWIGSSTGYITKWYDQINIGGTNALNDNTSSQPNLLLLNSKYVLNFITSNTKRTYLKLDSSGINPYTIFTHFSNDNVLEGTLFSTLNTGAGQRLGHYSAILPSTAGTRILGDLNEGDWFYSCGGTKFAYNNGVDKSYNDYNNTIERGPKLNVLSLSVETQWDGFLNESNMCYIGYDSYNENGIGWIDNIPNPTGVHYRGMNGYMIDFMCHNKQMQPQDMMDYYDYRLLFSTIKTIPLHPFMDSSFSMQCIFDVSSVQPQQIYTLYDTNDASYAIMDTSSMTDASYTFNFESVIVDTSGIHSFIIKDMDSNIVAQEISLYVLQPSVITFTPPIPTLDHDSVESIFIMNYYNSYINFDSPSYTIEYVHTNSNIHIIHTTNVNVGVDTSLNFQMDGNLYKLGVNHFIIKDQLGQIIDTPIINISSLTRTLPIGTLLFVVDPSNRELSHICVENVTVGQYVLSNTSKLLYVQKIITTSDSQGLILNNNGGYISLGMNDDRMGNFFYKSFL